MSFSNPSANEVSFDEHREVGFDKHKEVSVDKHVKQSSKHAEAVEEKEEGAAAGSSALSPRTPRSALAAAAGGSDAHAVSRGAAARVHKTVSFKPSLSTQAYVSNGSAPAQLGISLSGEPPHVLHHHPSAGKPKLEEFTSVSLSESSASQRVPLHKSSRGDSPGRTASSCATVSVPSEPLAAASRRPHSHQADRPSNHEPAAAAAGGVSKRLGSRITLAILAPFRELGGGELNFNWAYKEATSMHERSVFASASAYKATPEGSTRLSSRLSDAACKVPAGLHYFPLRFRDWEAEKEYVAVTNYQLSLRLSIYLLLQHCFLLPLQFALFFLDPFSRLAYMASDWFFKPFMYAFVGISAFGLLLAVALLYPCIIPFKGGYFSRKYAGQLTCLYSVVYSLALSASLIVGQLAASQKVGNPMHVATQPADVALVMQRLSSFHTEISLMYVYAFSSNLLLLDLIGPILTKWTLPLHVLITLGFAAPFIVGYVDGDLYSPCTLVSVVCTAAVLSFLAYLGHLSGELQHRLLFHQWRISRLRLIELLNEGGSTSGNATAMENVCGKILLQLKHVQQDFGEEFDELYKIVSECRRTLLKNENLYTVDLCHADRFSKHYMQLHTRYGTPQIEDLHSWSNQRSLATYQMKRSASTAGARLSEEMKDFLPEPEEPVQKQTTLQRRKLLNMAEFLSEAIGFRWSFSIIELQQETQGALFLVGASLLAKVVTDWGCSTDELSEFFYALQSQYQENPYHNQMHAAMVGHATVCLANMLDIWPLMDPIEKAALAVAALAHDVGHPGRTNQFFVMCFDPLAIIYNDNAPLENFHSCLCFRILERKSCNMFFLLSVGAFRFVRAKIIECILSTDMKQHFETISKFRVRRLNEEFSMHTSVEDRWAALKMCIKMGDLCHTSIAWPEHFSMTCAITEEFYQQGDEEMRRGLPVSPLCSRATFMDIPKSQESFLSFLARPLLVEIDELDATNRVKCMHAAWKVHADLAWKICRSNRQEASVCVYLLVAVGGHSDSGVCYFNLRFVGREEVLAVLDANMSRWKSLAQEGVAVPMPATEKRTQVRTFTLHAVRNLAAPALALDQNLPACEAGKGRYSKDPDSRVMSGRAALQCIHKDTLPFNPFDLAISPEEMASGQWSPRFTVDTTPDFCRDLERQATAGKESEGSQ
ncbi:hypothetical protein Efla_003143 [Eimeria flavescens]